MKQATSLPDAVQTLVRRAVVEKDGVGMSPAEVYKLTVGTDMFFLKTSNTVYGNTTYSVRREGAVLQWLHDKLPVPEIVLLESNETHECLVTRSVEGVALSAIEDTGFVVDCYAECISRLQSIAIPGCPFDASIDSRLRELNYLLEHGLAAMDDFTNGSHGFGSVEALLTFLQNERQAETLAFSHGDIGSSNIFVKDGTISGIIDWGRGGVADVHVDISFAANSIAEDLGDQTYVDRFLQILGTQVDTKKIRYFQLLDELF